MFVLNENFESLHITKETIANYMELDESQLEYMFKKFDYASLSNRIRKFYNAIEELDDQTIMLTHELVAKESKIHISSYMVFIENVEDNMFLPLLKRLFRYQILIEV